MIKRRLCLALGVLVAGLAVGLGAQAQDQGPIKIGLVTAKQGPFAEVGGMAAAGAEVALAQAGSKALGRPVQLTWLDEGNAQTAQQNFLKLVNEEKVSAIIGGSNSAAALAMAAEAKRVKVPLIVNAAAAREITGAQCNRYTFRTQVPNPAVARAMMPTLLKSGKDWYFLAGDYAYGHDIHRTFGQALTQAGGTEKGMDPIPVGTSDFSSYILKIKGAKPSVVVVGMGGTDQINFIKQWNEYDMKSGGPVLATPIVSDTTLWAVGPEAVTGIYGMQWHYTDPKNTPAEVEFVKAYIAKTGRPPAIEAWLGWTSMRALLAAIDKAGNTQPASIVKALETLSFEQPNGKSYYRAWDHQFVHPILVTQAVPPAGADKWNMIKIIGREPASADELDGYYGTPQDIGCKLDPL